MKKVVETSAALTVDVTMGKVLVTAGSSGNIAITLPNAVDIKGKFVLTVQKVDSGSSAAVITPVGSQTINGASTLSLANQYDTATIFNDGSNWRLMAGTNGSFSGNASVGGTLAVTGASTLTGAVALNGGATVATAKTLAVTDIDALTVGGKKIRTTWTVDATILASSVDQWFWIAPRACKVVSVKEIHSVVGQAGATLKVRKITDTSAPGAAAGANVIEFLQSALALDSTINTTVTGTLSATASDITLAAGDKVALDFNGTLTGLVGYLVVEFEAA